MVHVGADLLPQRVEQTWSETLVRSVSHQVGQTLRIEEGNIDDSAKVPPVVRR